MDNLHTLFFTECYTLFDALIWLGMGIALGAGIIEDIHEKKKRK